MSKKKLALLSSYLFYVFIIWLLNENVKNILVKSMPLREMYYPTAGGIFLFYIIPLLLGFLSGNVIKSKSSNPTIQTVLFSPLLLALLYLLPILFSLFPMLRGDAELFITLGFSFVFIPAMFLTGCLINFIGRRGFNTKGESRQADFGNSFLKYGPVCFVALLVMLLNVIPVVFAKYPVGRDVYAHISLSTKISQGYSFIRNPLFYERIHYYPPLVNLLIAKISQITDITILDLWRYYTVLFSGVFVFLFYYMAFKLTNKYNVAFLATLLMVPWSQVLWPDPTPRLFALCCLLLLIISLLNVMKGDKKHILIGGFWFAVILASHIEIVVHALIITLVVILLAKYYDAIIGFIQRLFNRCTAVRPKLVSLFSGVFEQRGLERKLYAMILIYIAIIGYFIVYGMHHYQGALFTVGEVGLSLLSPMGGISLIIFIFGLPNLMNAFKSKTPANIILLAIFFLYASIFFYFTKLWQFHHRYFGEVAFISLAVLAAASIVGIIHKRRSTFAIVSSLFLLLVFSTLPRFEWVKDYAYSTERTIGNKTEVLNMVSRLSDDSVILANPTDIVNRFIPAIAGRYIFSANYISSDETRWTIADFTVLPSDERDVAERFDLGARFFLDPSVLDEITNNYRLTHVLVTRKEYQDLELWNINRLLTFAVTDDYILLEVVN